MKKIFTIIAACALLALSVSCEKFDPGQTATQNLAGNWMCTVYVPGEDGFEPYSGIEIVTCNTAANLPTEIWIDDSEAFWGTKCKVSASSPDFTFGAAGVEVLDIYNEVGQMIWDGKVTENGAKAPGTNTTVDKIEFFIAFSDDEEPYAYPYYIVGYRRTGFPEDDDNFADDWTVPAMPTVPAVTQALPASAE